MGAAPGLDDAGLARKHQVLKDVAARTFDRLSALEALVEYGGFEIAMMAGAMCGAAERDKLVLVGGFIASVAARIARAISLETAQSFVYAHRSAEAGHRHVLDALGTRPLLELDFRLGEGTGALLVWPLVKAAAAMLNEMATFDAAQVSRSE